MLGTEKRGPRKPKMMQRKPQSQALMMQWLIEAWVGGDGSVAARLVQIGLEEERSRWRGSEEEEK